MYNSGRNTLLRDILKLSITVYKEPYFPRSSRRFSESFNYKDKKTDKSKDKLYEEAHSSE
jgi:hypothetical protein